MNLFEHNGGLISAQLFVDRLGPHIQRGDTICVEVDTMRFGRVSTGLKRDQFLCGVFDVFRQLVGDGGNIIIPTFSYSWGMDSPRLYFDVQNTPSKVGIFPEYFRKQSDVRRICDPMFSLAVWGADKNWLTGNEKQTSFGDGSLYSKVREKKTKLISFGLNRYDPTFIHCIEQYFHEKHQHLDYRYAKKFEGEVVDHTGRSYKTHQECFSRCIGSQDELYFDESRMVAELVNRGQFIKIPIGNAEVCVADCEAVFNVGIDGLLKNPHFFMNSRGK